MTRRMLIGGVIMAALLAALAVRPALRLLFSDQSAVSATGTRMIRSVRPPQFRHTIAEGDEGEILGNPLAIISDHDELYVSDAHRGWVAVLRLDGSLIRTIGHPESSQGQLRYPYGLALQDGQLYVADMGSAAIQIFTPGGEFLGTFSTPGSLSKPTDLEFRNRRLYVADAGLHQVLVLSETGETLQRIGGPGEAEGRFRYPNGVAVAEDGTLYVADSGNDRVQVFDELGRFVRLIQPGADSGPLTTPRGMAIDAHGTLYVVAGLIHTVVAFGPDGVERFRLTTREDKSEGLFLPNGIHVDHAGRIYVTESGSRRISLFQ